MRRFHQHPIDNSKIKKVKMLCLSNAILDHCQENLRRVASCLSVFPTPAANGGGGLGEYWASDGEFNWTGLGINMVYRCSVTNYFDRPLANVLLPIHLRFLKTIKRDDGGMQGEGINFERDWIINIAKIDQGSEKAFEFSHGITVTSLQTLYPGQSVFSIHGWSNKASRIYTNRSDANLFPESNEFQLKSRAVCAEGARFCRNSPIRLSS